MGLSGSQSADHKRPYSSFHIWGKKWRFCDLCPQSLRVCKIVNAGAGAEGSGSWELSSWVEMHSSSQGELDTRWPAQAGWLNRPEGWYATWCPIHLAMNGGINLNQNADKRVGTNVWNNFWLISLLTILNFTIKFHWLKSEVRLTYSKSEIKGCDHSSSQGESDTRWPA